ncbi:uncharacterized protein L969DRAFT_532109 [Mixia osmundae IAM 14324]|uniref:RNA helicase n=1 Tax=Mixia osmundae (strain CBS 9802 / IAM 14324 / JCM 22182 / KY 12970) TaxID=764103 RepID=G7E7I1_MIXOS|nr:uncharacterized protein L969DRAFT_532109 [Mixia osmundae IAM 14324]KEI38394.1 hypothetical protein L969DRAFT_532109 [Mixia osmundae IAM 14324]GAA98791.1 hypothetical protein E5Q_05479 [Mixia osmundae IAM 14324]
MSDHSQLDMLPTKSQAQRQKEKMERKAAQAKEAQEQKGISKKRKRLQEQYISKKLRKSQRSELLDSLAVSQSSVDKPLNLMTSSTLGSRTFSSTSDQLEKTQALSARKREKQRAKSQNRRAGYHSDSSSSSSSERSADQAASEPKAPARTNGKPVPSTPNLADGNASSSNGLGSALASGVQIVSRPPREKRPSAAALLRSRHEAVKPHLRAIEETGGLSDSDEVSSSHGELGQSDVSDADEEGEDPVLGAALALLAERGLDPKQLETLRRRADEEDGSDHTDDPAFGSSSDDDSNNISDADDETEVASDFDENEEWQGIETMGPQHGALAVEPVRLQADQPAQAKTDFKAWASEQIALADPSQPSSRTSHSEPPAKHIVHVEQGRGPMGEMTILPTQSLLDLKAPIKSTPVRVSRSTELQEARLRLPILAEEANIVETILLHPVVLVCGETGSGKTTQIPQFLYEAGFGSPQGDNPGMIGITQPRRVAATSMASRVAHELRLGPERVSHQVRFDSTTSAQTLIKFMTDGVLLRELALDFLLTRYSVIIIDEAHERTVNTDVLIGTLSRIVRLREKRWREKLEGAKPLRLIIMSATLRVEDFRSNATLFDTPPPIVEIKARQFAVTTHFSRRTKPDYLDEAFKKACRVHARLPMGGLLIFLTGQNEITTLCRRLESQYGRAAIADRRAKRAQIAQRQKLREGAQQAAEELPIFDVSMADEPEAMPATDAGRNTIEELEALDDTVDFDDEEALESESEEMSDVNVEQSDVPMHILPFYSLLPSHRQMQVFDAPPAGTRLVVVATNVAETSLTIPHISYVIDCGRAKEKQFDPSSGVQSFKIDWISKASAAQRAGRAGRTGPGHCYRLYSSAVFESFFTDHTAPEIARTPIEGVVLQMKAMNIDAVVNFPFPTPPERPMLAKAERMLIGLGALEQQQAGLGSKKLDAHVTELGRSMARYPLAPRFAKMLVIGQQEGCLPYVITAVAAMSVGDPFLHEQSLGDDLDETSNIQGHMPATEFAIIRDPGIRRKEELKAKRSAYFRSLEQFAALGAGTSDVFRVISAVGAFDYAEKSASFCEKHFLRAKAMQEIDQLRQQINRIVSAYTGADSVDSVKLAPPSTAQIKALRQLLTVSFVDQIAVRKDLLSSSAGSVKATTESCRGIAYRALGINEDVYVHPTSVLYSRPPPEFLCYQEVFTTNQTWLKGLTKVNSAWISVLCRPYCTYSKTLETVAKASADGKTRVCEVVPRFGAGLLSGEGPAHTGLGLELPAMQATQRKEGSRWVMA